MAKKILGTKMTKLGLVIRVECSRCAGTGNWDPNGYKVCYKCGGTGELAQDTAGSARNAKLAHIAEVKEQIAITRPIAHRHALPRPAPGSLARVATPRGAHAAASRSPSACASASTPISSSTSPCAWLQTRRCHRRRGSRHCGR